MKLKELPETFRPAISGDGARIKEKAAAMRDTVHTGKMVNLATDQLAAISRLFSSSVVRELARSGRSPLFARLVTQSRLLRLMSHSRRVSNVFENAFSLLKREGYRHEYIYKSALTHKILLGTHSLQTASMINEFRVGDCKADVAILNGTATVYEVKSERDSLARLKRQIAAYATVFAKVYVIAAEGHISSVVDTAPDFVGILCLNSRHRISTLRDAIDQPERTSPGAIFDSIRTEEARMILASFGVSVPRVPNTELYAVMRDAFVKLDPIQAQEGMVRVLKRTRNLLPLSALVDQLPPSLQTAALSVPMRKSDHQRLVAGVNTPLKDALGWA
ncbi:MAG: sce7726 family protein [Terracidiphilus sp.]